MSTGLRNRLESFTDYEVSEHAKSLIKSVLDSLKYHPFFFMLRNSVSSEDPVYPFAHQLELLGKLFARRPVRVLIGDEIGLGKTISAIMLIRYLIEVEGIKRVLILVPRVLVQQWLTELRRFNLTNVIQLERNTISSYRGLGFPQGVYLASIDLLKREEYNRITRDVFWDLVVVDEAHRVGKIGSLETQRFALVSQLVGKTNAHLIMLTATPHRGKPEDYIERLKLVDPFIKADPRELDDEKFYKLCMGSIVFRRTKLDVNRIYEKTNVFTNCKFKARVIKASEDEEAFHKELIEFLRTKLLRYSSIVGEAPKALPLLMTLIVKRASSSPRAAIITLDRIIQRRAKWINVLGNTNLHDIERDLEKEVNLIADAFLGLSFEENGLYEDETEEKVDVDELLERFAERCGVFLDERDIEELKRLHDLAGRIAGEKDSRLRSLVNVVLNHLRNGEKIVVFTEFRDTAEYIFNELINRLPKEFADKTAMITSKEIKPPACFSSRSRKYSIEDVKKWLRSGDVLLLVSTDVASEGLNLQVANVVIHYEPTWSPVKIVQRIGRVWRLGQKKDVTSYSLLLMVESDVAVLEVLYAKLLSWIVSGIEKSVVIGEELEIDMLPKEKTACDLLQIPLTSEKGRPQYSEFKAWIKFITGGKDKLRGYVEQIIAALMRLKEQAERLGLNKIESIKTEKFLEEGLGGLYGEEAKNTLAHLLKLTARFCGHEVEEKSSGIFIKDTHLTGLKDPLDMYRAIEALLKETAQRTPTILVVGAPLHRGIQSKELRLYEVTIYLNRRPTFSEVIGVVVKEDGSTEIRRGLPLFKLLLELMDNVVGVGDSFWSEEEFANRAVNSFLYTYNERIMSDYLKYLNEIEKVFGFQHSGWLPRGDSLQPISVSQKFLGVIVSTAPVEKSNQTLPPNLVEEVEERAMEYAMAFERRNQREPEDVSKREHYDIKSIDPKTGEIRFIEVKGRRGLDVTVELTEAEYNFGKTAGNNYWLYIVYGFSTGKPRLLAVRDPINKARWSVVEVKRYKFVGV